MKKSPGAWDHSLLQTVTQTIGRHGMLIPGDAVLAGVSGGPDSVALVHVLIRLADRFSLSMGIAHLNHCLRGEESDRDAQFVADLSRALGLPFYAGRKDIDRFRRESKLSPEEAARRARYEFFEETAVRHRFDKIALGHHADDNAELVLMNLLRGAGPVGISGIPPARDGRYVRPLLDLTRRRITEFLKENGIPFVTDSSNTDMRYTRNRIRHRLIPLLQNEYNPDIVRTLNRLAGILRAEEAWLDPVVRDLFDRCVVADGPDHVVLSVPELRRMTDAPRRRVMRQAIMQVKGSLRRIGLHHIDRLALGLPDEASGSAETIHLPCRICAIRTGREIRIVRKERPLRQACAVLAEPAFHYQVPGPMELRVAEIGRRLRFSAVEAEKAGDWANARPDTAFLDMAKLRFPLVVRNVRNGDRFAPLGLRGTQKMKTFFINSKVPVEARRRCPVLVSGDDDIIWVAGHRIAESVKVTASSEILLKVQLLLA
ncbi:tRNA lysidine(34) synthetase TilS [Desulfococcus sp.]|uniref:tRNA lysidine(34) synthetase TilS n=1 Tax=Desulfococcus sp. TaxID=2025834 RepID=UPI0035932492